MPVRHYESLAPQRYSANAVAPTFTGVTITDTLVRKEEKKRDIFELDVSYMHGDADYDEEETYQYENTEEGRKKLVEHCTFLAKCVTKFPHGMGGDDGYWDVEGYDEYGDDYIPRDNEHCVGHASVESFGVVYIDENGVEFEANLTV